MRVFFFLLFSLFCVAVNAQNALPYNSNTAITENSTVVELKNQLVALVGLYPNAYRTMWGTDIYNLFVTRNAEGVYSKGFASNMVNSGVSSPDLKKRYDVAVPSSKLYSGPDLEWTIDGVTYHLAKIKNGDNSKASCLNALGGNVYYVPVQQRTVTCPSVSGPTKIDKGSNQSFSISGNPTEILLDGNVRPVGITSMILSNQSVGMHWITLRKDGCPEVNYYVEVAQPQTPCKKVAITGKLYTWEPDLPIVLTANSGTNFHWYQGCDTTVGLCYRTTVKFPGVYHFGYSFEQEGRLCYGTDSFRVNSNIRIQSDCEGMTIVGVRQGENDFVSSYAHLYVEHPMKQLSSKKWDKKQKPKKQDVWTVEEDSVTGKQKRINRPRYQVDTNYIYTDLNVFSCFFSGSAKLPEGKYKAYVSLEPAAGSYPNDCMVDKEHKKVTRQYAANFYSINCGVQGNQVYAYNSPRQTQPVMQQNYSGYYGYGSYGSGYYGSYYQYRPYYGGLNFPWCWGIYQGNSCVGYSFPTSCHGNYSWNNNHCPIPNPGYTPQPIPTWNHGGGNGGNGGLDPTNPGGGNGGNGGNGGWNQGGGQ